MVSDVVVKHNRFICLFCCLYVFGASKIFFAAVLWEKTMEVKHIQPGHILGSSGLLPFVVPSLITPSLLIGLLIAISGYDKFVQFFNSLTPHQASLLLILFGTSIVWNAYFFKTRIYFAELYPETLFSNEVAGRFSLLVT